MRLQKTDQLGGLPATEARRVLRVLRGDRFTADDLIGEIRTTEQGAWMRRFADDGLIEPTGDGWWRTTIKGNAVANAGFGRPISRATAQPHLDDLLVRVAEVNADEDLLLDVVRVRLYGSFLDEGVDPVGDVDVDICLARRLQVEDRFVELSLERAASAEAAGRTFGSYLDRLAWSDTEVWLRLKNRSRVLSLSRDDPILERVPFRVLYERG